MPLEFTLPFFQWCDDTRLGQWVRGGQWEFPIIESIHILALTLLFAIVVVINLRLMGLMMKGWAVSELTGELSKYLNASIVVILITGTLLFLSEALKAFDNPAFWFKAYLLVATLIFHFTIYNKTIHQDEVAPSRGWTMGLLSLFGWIGLGWAGRAIGFV
jgi:hypothetical protein